MIKITTWARLASALCSHFEACPFGGPRIMRIGKEFLFLSHTVEEKGKVGRQEGETFC